MRSKRLVGRSPSQRRSETSEAEPLGFLPSPSLELLLEAGLAGPERAQPAFEEWLGATDLDEDLGWDVVHLLPLVFYHQKRLGVTAPILGRFRGVYRRTWYENQRVLHAARSALGALQKHRIDPLVVDDAALAFAWYESPGLRPISGLDLLISPSNVPDAIAVLAQAGWRAPTEAGQDDFRFADHLTCVGSEDLQVRIHWSLLPGGQTPPVRDTDCSGDIPGLEETAVKRLDPASQLLRTIVRAHRDDGRRYFPWVADGLMLLSGRGGQIDWSRFLATAGSLRLTGQLAAALGYLAENFGASIPGEVMNTLSMHRAGWVERAADAIVRARITEATPREGAERSLRREFLRYFERTRRVGNPVRAALDFSHLLRYRWNLSGRRDILPVLFRSRDRNPAGSRADH